MAVIARNNSYCDRESVPWKGGNLFRKTVGGGEDLKLYPSDKGKESYSLESDLFKISQHKTKA